MDTNLLTNKIISIIVALVVALCVLVPVANAYGGEKAGAPVYWMDWVSDVLPHDDHQPIVLHASDFDSPIVGIHEDGNEVLFIKNGKFLLSRGPEEHYGNAVGITQFGDTITVYVDTHSNVVRIWDGVQEDIYNYTSNNLMHGMYWTSPEAPTGDNTKYCIALRSAMVDEAEDDSREAILDESYNPILDFAGFDKLGFGDAYADSFDSVEGESDTGMVGTLVQLIPLFVILAILLSVTTMMVGKGRFGLTE